LPMEDRTGIQGGDSRKRTGCEGEEEARHFLEAKGYRTVARNFRHNAGEIDLIARDGDTLVFIEVKTKRHQGFGDPESWIGRRKQDRIARVAMGYLHANRLENQDCRFDVVTVDLTGKTPVVEHIADAFWLSPRAARSTF